MDIDDILASVDREHVPAPESASTDHQLLTRYWVAERAAPELLRWPGPLMDRMMERVTRQIESIEDLTATSSDPAAPKDPNINLKLCILQTDLSRTQYLLRSLLRQRLDKLARFSMHYLLVASQSQPQSQSQSQTQTQTPEDSIPNPDHGLGSGNTMLSPRETSFLHAHQKLLARHYGSSFLGSFPPQLRRLDDNAGGTSMVQGPDAKEVVFARCLADEVRVVVPAGEGVDEELGGISMQMGDVWVVRWEGVREAWARGEVEVL